MSIHLVIGEKQTHPEDEKKVKLINIMEFVIDNIKQFHFEGFDTEKGEAIKYELVEKSRKKCEVPLAPLCEINSVKETRRPI